MRNSKIKLICLLLAASIATSCNVIKLVKISDTENIVFNSGYNDFLYVDNQIIFETMFSDGKNRNLLFDLGAPTNIIFLDSTISQLIENQEPYHGFRKVGSADGITQKQIYYHFGTLATNNFTIENSFILAASRPDLDACTKINGLFGATNFTPEFKGEKNKIINIQMQDSTLAILDALPPLDNWIPVEAKFSRLSQIKIAITISGKKYWFYFDTGFGGSVGMKRKTYKNTKDKSDTAPNEKKAYGYITNTLSGPQFDTAYIGIANFSLDSELMADSIQVISTKSLNVDVVGMEFIRRYNVLVDYQNKKLYLQPNPNYKYLYDTFFITKGFKVKNMESEKILIMNITMNSPAEKAGLKFGDQLIGINNTMVNHGTNCETLKLFSMIDGNDCNNEITVKRDGETLKFIL